MKILFLTSEGFDTPNSINHLCETLLEDALKSGLEVHCISSPFPIAYAGAWVLYWVTLKKKDYREKVQRLCEPRVYPHDDATRDFGYAPRSFRVGIVDEVEEYKAHRG